MSGLISAAAKRLRDAMAAVGGAGLLGFSTGQAYAADTVGAQLKQPTFTGPVTLPGDAAGALHAVPLQQLTAAIAAAVASIADGQTFTGPVTLAGDANASLQAVTLQQMSAAIAGVISGSYAEPPGDIKLSLTPTPAAGASRILVEGQAISLTTYPTLAMLWCGAGFNAAGSSDFFYRCTNAADPNGSRSNGGDYLVLPPPGYFLRVLNGTGAGVDAGRNRFLLQEDEFEAHSHGLDFLPQSGSSTWCVTGAGTAGQTGVTGGNETRPKNWGVYVWLCY